MNGVIPPMPPLIKFIFAFDISFSGRVMELRMIRNSQMTLASSAGHSLSSHDSQGARGI